MTQEKYTQEELERRFQAMVSRRAFSNAGRMEPVVEFDVARIENAPSESSLEFTVRLMDEELTRNGTKAKVEAWNFENYRKNPVVLTDHDISAWRVVGQSPEQWREGNALYAKIRLNENDPDVERLIPKIRSGSLRAVSLAAFVHKYRWERDDNDEITGNIIIDEAEIYEISLVGVGAVASALVTEDSVNTEDKDATQEKVIKEAVDEPVESTTESEISDPVSPEEAGAEECSAPVNIDDNTSSEDEELDPETIEQEAFLHALQALKLEQAIKDFLKSKEQ